MDSPVKRPSTDMDLAIDTLDGCVSNIPAACNTVKVRRNRTWKCKLPAEIPNVCNNRQIYPLPFGPLALLCFSCGLSTTQPPLHHIHCPLQSQPDSNLSELLTGSQCFGICEGAGSSGLRRALRNGISSTSMTVCGSYGTMKDLNGFSNICITQQ